MLVADTDQNNTNRYLLNDTKICSSRLSKTYTSPCSTSFSSTSTITNNNLIKFQIPTEKSKSFFQISTQTLLKQLPYEYEISRSLNTERNISINSVKNASIKKCDSNVDVTNDIFKNELIKRLQGSESSKSITLNRINNNKKNKTNCIAPTDLHRLPNPRDLTSVDSLNLEMCHFKPIKPVPITPIKRPNAVIIKTPVAKKLRTRIRKCDVFIGPKKGLMPILFSTTTSERFSAFCLYNKILILPPLLKQSLQHQMKSNISKQIGNSIKKNDKQKTKNTFKSQKFTKKMLFKRKCIVQLKKIKILPKLELSETKTNFETSEIYVNLNNSNKTKLNFKNRKIIEKQSRTLEFTTKKPKRILRSHEQRINNCETQLKLTKLKKKNCAITPNTFQISSYDNDPIQINVNETDINTKSERTKLFNEKINDKKKTRIELQQQKKQERLDFEFAKRLQDQYIKESGIVQPVATRLRKSISSNISLNLIMHNEDNFSLINHRNIKK